MKHPRRNPAETHHGEAGAIVPEPRWPADWEPEGERRYGETKVWFAGPRHPEGVA